MDPHIAMRHPPKNQSQARWGQFFTTHPSLKEQVCRFVLNQPTRLLEPCIGRGDLVECLRAAWPSAEIDMYEIDHRLPLLPSIAPEEAARVQYVDFLRHPVDKRYATIVGNPPYVRTKRGNLYIDFTQKCFSLLENGGELIFIVPSDFFKVTRAAKLLNQMMAEGTFTHIYHPHDESLFEQAAVDVLVFRYRKHDGRCPNTTLPKRPRVLYNDSPMLLQNNQGLVTFLPLPVLKNNEEDGNGKEEKEEEKEEEEKEKEEPLLFQDVFDVFVGLVSGKDAVFKHAELGNLEVLTKEGITEKFVCVKSFPCEDDAINAHLMQHKHELLRRQIRSFHDDNWFEWGALRNFQAVQSRLGAECIYLANLTRKPSVAFVGHVSHFGGSLILLCPKPHLHVDLPRTAEFLNGELRPRFLFSGRFKIGHRQISLSPFPSHLCQPLALSS